MSSWHPDFLDGYDTIDLPLRDIPRLPGEPVDTLSATLIRRAPGNTAPTAVLYIHGWNDYFFQTHLAQHMSDLGYDFYAIDLRRCGRSYRPGQLRGFIDDLDAYQSELGQAADIIAADHDRLLVFGHSTGGLIAALWADHRPDQVGALILNSPWLEIHRPGPLTAATTTLLDYLGRRRPTTVLPLPDLGLSARSVHTSFGGEWDYNLEMKTTPSPPVRLGWLRAVLAGQTRVAAGLRLPMPVLVLSSTTHTLALKWTDSLRAVDTVLDVEGNARRAAQLGDLVTVVRLQGAMHDVILSAQPVRERAFTEIARWCTAHG